jgi:hypothetical protein
VGLSPFLLPLVLLSPVDASKGFMFPSWGVPRSTPTLPHQGVMMFPTPPPSGVPRMRRDDFELESSNDERDWAYMHDFQIRDSDICAGYAFPRGTGLPRNGVSASPVDASKGFMFHSWGVPRSTPTLPHQWVMMFPIPPPSGVPRRGITTPPF